MDHLLVDNPAFMVMTECSDFKKSSIPSVQTLYLDYTNFQRNSDNLLKSMQSAVNLSYVVQENQKYMFCPRIIEFFVIRIN